MLVSNFLNIDEFSESGFFNIILQFHTYSPTFVTNIRAIQEKHLGKYSFFINILVFRQQTFFANMLHQHWNSPVLTNSHLEFPTINCHKKMYSWRMAVSVNSEYIDVGDGCSIKWRAARLISHQHIYTDILILITSK